MSFESFFFFGTIIVALYMAWTVGANDVANAMGTSVGSKALTFKKAIIVAAIFEFLGSVLVGSHVSETIKSEIIKPEIFANQPQLLIIGMFSALIAAALWLHLATFLGMPVSTTHSIVGAVLGFGLIYKGVGAVEWGKTTEIFLSWVVSPLCGGVLAYLTFSYINKKVLNVDDAIPATIKLAPKMIFIVITILVLSFIYKGLKNLHLNLPFPEALGVAIVIGVIVSIIGGYLIRRMNERTKIPEYEFVEQIFKYLQIMTACYIAFAHGANDVANAIGPAAAVVSLLHTKSVQMSVGVPLWLLILGGFGIILGITMYGYKVIVTIGGNITAMTPSRGFSATFATATTVLVCSKMGLPISTTHTIVGAVIGVGFARGISALNLNIIKNIIFSWIITLPLTAVISLGLFQSFKWIFIK